MGKSFSLHPMNNRCTILGIITARGGSKGISRKNMRELCGRPLIAYTIDAASNSKYLTRTIVSTEDAEIANIAKKLGADVPFMRPDKLAQAHSSSIDVVINALEWLEENENQKFNYVMILQPTSPLRTAEDIDACIKKAIDTDADSIISMVELSDMSLPKLKKIENDLIIPFIEEEGATSTSRRDGEPIYKRNAAIYLTKTEWLERGNLFGRVSRPYIMPAERSIDINEPIDFEISELLLSKKT